MRKGVKPLAKVEYLFFRGGGGLGAHAPTNSWWPPSAAHTHTHKKKSCLVWNKWTKKKVMLPCAPHKKKKKKKKKKYIYRVFLKKGNRSSKVSFFANTHIHNVNRKEKLGVTLQLSIDTMFASPLLCITELCSPEGDRYKTHFFQVFGKSKLGVTNVKGINFCLILIKKVTHFYLFYN